MAPSGGTAFTHYPPRRSHRKRSSLTRLSSDTTTSTLPEYNNFSPWRPSVETPSDQPPDYPDSADEADEDSDTDNSHILFAPHPHSQPNSPRRPRRNNLVHNSRRRPPAAQSTDSFLDTLLERSVHALEMSNTLLHSSMATQTSLSTILSSDSLADHTLEVRARDLSDRVKETKKVQRSWAVDLDEISRGVDSLFEDEDGDIRSVSASRRDSGFSSSLPSSSAPSLAIRRQKRMPSLDLRLNTELPQLHLSPQDRTRLVAPPPRAITQYVASSADPDTILLPSTLGLRALPSTHADWRSADLNSNGHQGVSLASGTSPVLTDKPLEPSTPAYNMLSTFFTRASSSPRASSPASSIGSSFLSRSHRGSTSKTVSLERTHSRTRTPHRSNSPERPRIGRPGSSPITPHLLLTKRPLTPLPSDSHHCETIEEVSSSDDSCRAKLTVLSLRKILDDQPLPSPASTKKPEPPPPKKAPLALSPSPAASSSTSTATASISRLYTKSIHSSSTKPPDPPKQSSLKRPSAPGTPARTPSPTMLSIPDLLLGGGVIARARALSGNTSSGSSTPKRISFAELPESYASSRPPGSAPSKFAGKKKGKRKHGKGSSVDSGSGSGSGSGGEWWAKWLMMPMGPHGESGIMPRLEGVKDDKRHWSTRPGGIDDWTV